MRNSENYSFNLPEESDAADIMPAVTENFEKLDQVMFAKENITQSTAVTEKGQYAVDARELNASIGGTLANKVKEVANKVKEVANKVDEMPVVGDFYLPSVEMIIGDAVSTCGNVRVVKYGRIIQVTISTIQIKKLGTLFNSFPAPVCRVDFPMMYNGQTPTNGSIIRAQLNSDGTMVATHGNPNNDWFTASFTYIIAD